MKQTKSNISICGWFNKVLDYREGTTNTGKEYRAIRFSIKTTEKSYLILECFGMVRDTIYLFSRDKDDKTTKQVPWKNRHKEYEDYYSFKQPYDMAEELATMEEGTYLCFRTSIAGNYFQNKQGEDIVTAVFQVDNFYEPIDEPDIENVKEAESCLVKNMQLAFNSLETIGGVSHISGFLIDYKEQTYPLRFKINNPTKIKSLKSIKRGDLLDLSGVIATSKDTPGSDQKAGWVETEDGMEYIDPKSPRSQRAEIIILGAKSAGVSLSPSELMNNSVTNKPEPTKPTVEEEPEEPDADEDLEDLLKDLM